VTETSHVDNPYRPPAVASELSSGQVSTGEDQRSFVRLGLLGASGLLTGGFVSSAVHCTAEFVLGRKPPAQIMDGVVCILLIACAASSSTVVFGIYKKQSTLSLTAAIFCVTAFCGFLLTIGFAY